MRRQSWLQNNFNWDFLNFAVLFGCCSIALSEPVIKLGSAAGDNIVEVLTPAYKGDLNNLFANNSSPGVIAICAAEGNCQPDGKKTSLYYGHIDDGNRKVNRGWCSDQGRGGTNLANADAGCLSRTQSRISRLVQRMRAARVEPEQHIEAFVNASDLWNQASPRVSDAFAKNYAEALKKGLKNKEAILWARVESFRKSDGELEAGNSNFGLFSICANPRNTFYTTRLRQYPMWSERWRWNCIALDQRRRLEQINIVLTRLNKTSG